MKCQIYLNPYQTIFKLLYLDISYLIKILYKYCRNFSGYILYQMKETGMMTMKNFSFSTILCSSFNNAYSFEHLTLAKGLCDFTKPIIYN